MYAPFVKGGPEGLEDSWDGKIANLFYSVRTECTFPPLHFEDKTVSVSSIRTRCTPRL
jgi:hypothetical protein